MSLFSLDMLALIVSKLLDLFKILKLEFIGDKEFSEDYAKTEKKR